MLRYSVEWLNTCMSCRICIESAVEYRPASIDLFLSYRTDSTDSRTI